MTKAPRPLETYYAGHLFRSRQEAKWAVFFRAMGLQWEYERQGFSVGTPPKPYLPDFYLPELGLWVEVKPAKADVADPRGVRLWEDFAAEVGTDWDRDKTAMFLGPVPDPAQVDELGPPRPRDWYDAGIVILGDWRYAWCACPAGEHFDVAYEARGGRILCGCPRITDDRYRTGDHPRILAAYRAARAARFEHGQQPAA